MATWYLNADSGNDSAPGDGSSANPWLTISKAHTMATAGDTVILQTSTANYLWASNITFTKSLTIQGAVVGNNAKLDAANGDAYWILSDGVTLTAINLTFQNAQIGAWAFLSPFAEGSTSSFVFTNCIFRKIKLPFQTYGYAMFYDSVTNKNVVWSFTNCLFLDIYGNTGITTAHLFHLYGHVAATSSITFLGCTFVFLNNSADKLGNIWNNISVGPLTVKNCIFYNGRGSTISWGTSDATTTALTYSCFYQLTDTPAMGAGCITSDPLLVDPANENVNLRPNSPCFDTGTLI